jgi:hypothetical protein
MGLIFFLFLQCKYLCWLICIYLFDATFYYVLSQSTIQ